MDIQTFRSSAAAIVCFCLTLTGGRLNAGPTDFDGMETGTSALLDTAYDQYNSLHFDQAEAEIRQAVALQPDLPAPGLYLEDELSCQIRELHLSKKRNRKVEARFNESVKSALVSVNAWELAHHDGRGQLYLGTSLGECGIVAMLEGNYLAAYGFGQKANAALMLARSRDAELLDVDMGLGEYLYYCGNFNGLLRAVMDLHGNVPAGIILMQTCAAGTGRGALPARLELAWIMTEETRDYERALPYVREVLSRYPENWTNVMLALDEARGLGIKRTEARELIESVCVRWDSGWRPPAYASVNPGPQRLALAKAYILEKRFDDARRHLTALSKGAGKTATEASTMIAGLDVAPPEVAPPEVAPPEVAPPEVVPPDAR